jgi:hypothetical protein
MTFTLKHEIRRAPAPTSHVNAPPTRRERTPTQGGARRRCYPLPPRRRRGGEGPPQEPLPPPGPQGQRRLGARPPALPLATQRSDSAATAHTFLTTHTAWKSSCLMASLSASLSVSLEHHHGDDSIITVMTASCIHAQRTAREECYSFASCSASSSELQRTHSHIGQAHRIGARM